MIAEALVCLALNVYHEARGEPVAGREAVASVVLNMARDPGFPSDVCAVVRQGGERRHRCQFWWWCDGRADEAADRRAWGRAVEVAERAIAGKVPDATCGAVFYHTLDVSPYWMSSFHETVRIGRHIFYAKSRCSTQTRP